MTGSVLRIGRGHLVRQLCLWHSWLPHSDVPLGQIAAAGKVDVKPIRIFRVKEIHEAHPIMEANEARGKMIVVHD